MNKGHYTRVFHKTCDYTHVVTTNNVHLYRLPNSTAQIVIATLLT